MGLLILATALLISCAPAPPEFTPEPPGADLAAACGALRDKLIELGATPEYAVQKATEAFRPENRPASSPE